MVGNSIGFCQDGFIRSLESGHFTEGELLEEVWGLIGLPEHEVLGDCELGLAVLGGDEGLLGTEVIRIRVEGLKMKEALKLKILQIIHN